MTIDNPAGQPNMFTKDIDHPNNKKVKKAGKKKAVDDNNIPEKLGKAIRLPVPDFSDPNRKPTCLEADFPIAQINALAGLEASSGAAKKPIYSMSKWWARRQSSVFRSLLIAAATESPDDPNEAAKLVWDHYYSNHQKAYSFKKLRVLDPFMGGGTTLVEGSRLGMQMTGVDLNPVAWFVVKNELACSDPEQVQNLFDHIEQEVKPQIQPFYTTTCPRGHKGVWIDIETDQVVEIDPLEVPPEERKRYRWQGPEVIYTFWAKHGSCQARGCGHRTPIFLTPVVAEKKLSTYYLELNCPACGHNFHTELGETRMAPGAERVILEGEQSFTEMKQDFAQLIKDYDKGRAADTITRMLELKDRLHEEQAFCCPECSTFSGKKFERVLNNHSQATRAADRKKKAFGVKRKPVKMYLLMHPEWLTGASGFDQDRELGGWAGAPAEETASWFDRRMSSLEVVEVRGDSLPDEVALSGGASINTKNGTIPRQAHFVCGRCGKSQNRLEATKKGKHTAPVAAYTIQCHCPQCEVEGYNFKGRYFQTPLLQDVTNLDAAEREWEKRSQKDLKGFWPQIEISFSMRTHIKDPLPDHGYTHWWQMFNARQLLVHTQLLKTICNAPEDVWPLDVREQVLGAFQQYLRSLSMFSFYHQRNDQLAAALSNPNFNPKNLVLETCVFFKKGSGRWGAYVEGVVKALRWVKEPSEPYKGASASLLMDDLITPGTSDLLCRSSTALGAVHKDLFDMVITDPPFGDNLYYADLADFFYVWLRIPLLKWYEGFPEQQYFQAKRTPHSMEAIDNPAEHPDDREDYEKTRFIGKKHLQQIQKLADDNTLQEKSLNPFFRPQPSSDFYSQTLSACWAESGRMLKDGGIMAFTFHHNEDQAWIDILKALFEAGFLLVATYPIRSDESKGDSGQFGSKKIEYDIIHVCRKRLEEPQPVSWARMRRWVKEEARLLKELLEYTHGKELPESDLRVILRGKSLEFYSGHYGQVLTGDGQILNVRDALLGINQLLDDLLEDTSLTGGIKPPDIAEPASRLYLRLFRDRKQIPRDELHKILRGTGISQGYLEARGWIRMIGKEVHVVPIQERFDFFTGHGRNRKIIKTDLDQAHFLIGAALPKSGVKIDSELDNPNLKIKKAVDDILKWYGDTTSIELERLAAKTAYRLVDHWRNRRRKSAKPAAVQLSLFEVLEAEE